MLAPHQNYVVAGSETNYPHFHMKGTDDHAKREYLKFKAGVLKSCGLVVWCKYCDKKISKHCCLSESEQFFHDTLTHKRKFDDPQEIETKPSKPKTVDINESLNVFRKEKKKLSNKRAKKRKYFEYLKSLNLGKNKMKQKKEVGQVRKVINAEPFIIEPENIADLTDLSENVHTTQPQLSKIKINITNKPLVKCKKIKEDVAAATTAAIHNSTATYSRSVDSPDKPATDGASTIEKSDHKTQGQRSDPSDGNPRGAGNPIPSLLQSTCRNMQKSKKSPRIKKMPGPSTSKKKQPRIDSSLLVTNLQTFREEILEKNLAPPFCRTGVPRDFNNCMIGEAERQGPENVRENLDSKDEIKEPPPGAVIPDLLMSVYQKPKQSEQRDQEPMNDRESDNPKSPDTRTEPDDVPTHKQPDILCSVDKTVQSLVRKWPWLKPLREYNNVSHLGVCPNQPEDKFSRSALDEAFLRILANSDLHQSWIKVTVTGYPRDWTRERVLDSLINWGKVAQHAFTPCFIEFTARRCKFLVRQCDTSLRELFCHGLVAHGEGYRLNLELADLRIALRFRLQRFLQHRFGDCYRHDTLDLTQFLLQNDIMFMCHFPLNKPYNQRYIVTMDSQIQWRRLTELILARNRLTSIDHFDLVRNLPSLRSLDLGHNCLETVSALASCRGMLSLASLVLEGNPLCHGFVQQEHYTDAVRLLFPRIRHLDGVTISGLPESVRNYCPFPDARLLVDQFLETYFCLLESKSRGLISGLYSVGATFSVSCQEKLKKNPDFENIDLIQVCRDLRQINEIYDGSIVGNESIAQHLAAWLPVCHDPCSFTVDVLSYTEGGLVVSLTGALRVLCRPQPADCPLLDFSRTFVLSTRDGAAYVINNDMWHLAEPQPGRVAATFQHIKARPPLTLDLESAPSEELANELISIVMDLTKLNRSRSARCLEMRTWNLRSALLYFLELDKSNLAALDSVS